MDSKYFESGKIEELHLNKGQITSPIDGRVNLSLAERVSGKTVSLECFLGGHAELVKWKKIRNDDSILLRLVLLNWQYTSTRPSLLRRKEVKYLGNCEYRVQGEILELGPHPSYEDSVYVIIDCGIYMQTRVARNISLKVGDYVSAEGCLDAHIMGEVK